MRCQDAKQVDFTVGDEPPRDIPGASPRGRQVQASRHRETTRGARPPGVGALEGEVPGRLWGTEQQWGGVGRELRLRQRVSRVDCHIPGT